MAVLFCCRFSKTARKIDIVTGIFKSLLQNPLKPCIMYVTVHRPSVYLQYERTSIMKTITYSDYFNRVYGCFLGKCIGGTAGGPAEGRKELLDYPLDEAILHTALPNDDLDLQILWLEVMEEKGIDFTARDLAQSFYDNAPYGPGEYAYFKKNFGRGIMPPLSGSFNNRFYKNGMGCPIRSEIWACICPGDPARTWRYVEMDGTMDHEYDSVLAEYFLAAAESMAFFRSPDDSIAELLSDALTYLPTDAKITQALGRTLQLSAEQRDWKWIRSDIIRRYGHPDCTNLYQNMCFTLIALLYGKGDMRETIRLGCAMGYDTDCICAVSRLRGFQISIFGRSAANNPIKGNGIARISPRTVHRLHSQRCI